MRDPRDRLAFKVYKESKAYKELLDRQDQLVQLAHKEHKVMLAQLDQQAPQVFKA